MHKIKENMERQIEKCHDAPFYTLGPVSYTHLDVYKRQAGPTAITRKRWNVYSTFTNKVRSCEHFEEGFCY